MRLGTGRHVRCLFLSRQGVKTMVIRAAWNEAMDKVMEITETGFHSEQMREAGGGALWPRWREIKNETTHQYHV